MTDEKKKFIRISSEYEGGLTINRRYALLRDDKPDKTFSANASCDEGWLVVKNYEDFELENGKIKVNKKTGRNYIDADVEINDTDVVEYKTFDESEGAEHIEDTHNCTKEEAEELLKNKKDKLLCTEIYRFDKFELPVRIEYIDNLDAPYERLKFPLNEEGYKE